MSAIRWVSSVSASLVGLACALTGAAPVAAQAVDPAQQQSLVLQKLRLAEQVLGSPRAQELAGGADAEARATLARARALLEEARQGADLARAERQVNEALRLASLATRGRMAGVRAADGQQQRNAELRTQIDDYRRGMVEALRARRVEGRSPALVAVDQHLAEADALAGAGRHADAAAEYERAYRAAVQGLSRLRDGETVTIALTFDTPAEEYAYEQKRFQSHDLLVDLALTERNPTGSMRNAIEVRREQAHTLRDRAAESANRGDYKAAIGLLEDATRGLVRALQAAGVSGLY